MVTKAIRIGMGDGAVLSEPGVITSRGIGSCVVVTLYDSARRIGGMAHVVLPHSGCACQDISCYYCADTAIAALSHELCRQGAVLDDLVTKMAGGAAMFSTYENGIAGIGAQIIYSLKSILAAERIPLVGWDIAGHHGRSVDFYLNSGRMVVKAIGLHDKSF